MNRARTDEVDVLRGAALLGICVVNVPVLAGIDLVTPPAALLDRLAAGLVALLFQGKFFVLFSFLFGWGFEVQRARARGTGRRFGAAYARRLACLLAIGVVHALFVFTGDILVLYALLGAVLWCLRNVGSRRLLQVSGALTGVAVLALAALGIAIAESPSSLGAGGGYLGSFADAVRERWREWPFAFDFVLAFNGPIALAAFAAGLVAARHDFFEPGAASYLALRRRWPTLLGAGLLLNTAYAGGAIGALGDDWLALLAFAPLAVGGPCLASVYLLGIVEAVRRVGGGASLAGAGRLSASAYVAEGVVAGLLFNGYGLGLFGRVGDAACLGIAVAIHAFVHTLCTGWWRWLGPGPLEQLLRAATRGSARRPDQALR